MKLRRSLRECAGSSEASPEAARAQSQRVVWRVASSLSVALHRGNFQVLSSFRPSLSADLAPLGRPLSESPEPWRAAPAAALPWAEELL